MTVQVIFDANYCEHGELIYCFGAHMGVVCCVRKFVSLCS